MEDLYLTVAQNASAVYRDRGSKFLGYAWEVTSVEQAQAFLQQTKDEHPSATHHCFAWRLGVTGEQYRAYDDGEPAGTAGRPIYDALRSAQLTNVMVVVVRYFGGTQLGKPGLIQAYKETTVAVIAAAGTIEKVVTIAVNCRFAYEWMNVVMTELKKANAVVLQMDSGEDVHLRFEIRQTSMQDFKNKLIDKTQRQIVFD